MLAEICAGFPQAAKVDDPLQSRRGRCFREGLRQHSVTLLDYAEIDERRFASWRMGRVDLDKLNVGVVLNYSEKAQLDPFQISGRVALALLDELMSTASIVGGG